MGAWGGDNAPGRSRANRPSLRNPHRVRPPDDPSGVHSLRLLGACVCPSRPQGPATDMGRMEQRRGVYAHKLQGTKLCQAVGGWRSPAYTAGCSPCRPLGGPGLTGALHHRQGRTAEWRETAVNPTAWRSGYGHGRSPNPAPSEEEGVRGQRSGGAGVAPGRCTSACRRGRSCTCPCTTHGRRVPWPCCQ